MCMCCVCNFYTDREHFNSCFEIRDFSYKMISQTLGELLFLIIRESFVICFSWEARIVRTSETLKIWILSWSKTVQKTWKKVPVLNCTSVRHRINVIKRQRDADSMVCLLGLQFRKLNADHFLKIHTNISIYFSLNNL